MTIRETLLISMPKALDLLTTIKEMSFQIGIGIFFVSLLFEFFYQMDFLGVLKRLFVAIASIIFFQTFLISSANIGLTFADAIITPNNSVLKEWKDARDSFQNEISDRAKDTVDRYNAGDKSLSASSFLSGNSYEKLKKNIGDDLLMWFIYFLAKISLYFVSFTYTLSYYLTLLLFPLIAMVSIFPLTKEAHHSSFLTCIWLGITPVVVAIILNICDLLNNPTNIAANLMSRFIFSVIMAFYLIRSFSVAKQAVAGSGIAGAAAKMSEGLSNSVVMSVLATGMSRVTRPLNTIVRNVAKTVGNTISGGNSTGSNSLQNSSYKGHGNNLHSESNLFEGKLDQLSGQKSSGYNSPTTKSGPVINNTQSPKNGYMPPRQADPNERLINLSEIANGNRGQANSSINNRGDLHLKRGGESFYTGRDINPSTNFKSQQQSSNTGQNQKYSNSLNAPNPQDRSGKDLHGKYEQSNVRSRASTSRDRNQDNIQNQNINKRNGTANSAPSSKKRGRQTSMRDNKRG